MSATAERKRMWVADVVLRRAAELVRVQLASPMLPTDLDNIDIAGARDANRANLDLLESLGRARDLRGGFWRDLMRACEMLGLEDRMPALVAEFRAALQRVGAPAAPSADADTRTLADAICQLPLLFRSTGNRSMVDLLASTGYAPNLTPLTRADLIAGRSPENC